MKNNDEIQKPYSMIMEEATIEMIDKVNEIAKKYNLNFYLLQQVINFISGKISQEIENEKQAYLASKNKESEDK